MPNKKNIIRRPPVVVVMGHIDHGKSTLLDYIRKTNVVESETGGITQHISAYEVIHKSEEGEDRKITFLDTPGHEAFSKMRERGAQIADIAILIVSAEDSVKAQTVEALQTIRASKIPFIVAINKIDKPGADPEKTKIDLAEKEVYLEGFGGDVPYAQISAKTGQGVDDLLGLILLVADLNDFKSDNTKLASGYVLESELDPRRGVAATLIIKDGSIKKGSFVVAGEVMCGTRIFENFMGQPIEEAVFSSPIQLVGWNKPPTVGEVFTTFENKNVAEKQMRANKENAKKTTVQAKTFSEQTKLIPIIVKADTFGGTEAIEKELQKLNHEIIAFQILQKNVGDINENDVRLVSGKKNGLIVGFNVKIDRTAIDLNEQIGIPIKNFDTIYKLIEWLGVEMESRRPRIEVEEVSGKAKIQKLFSQTKNKQVIGGKVYEGKIISGSKVKVLRRENQIGEATIIELQHNKERVKEVETQNEFGMAVESKIDLAPGDILEAYIKVVK